MGNKDKKLSGKNSESLVLEDNIEANVESVGVIETEVTSTYVVTNKTGQKQILGLYEQFRLDAYGSIELELLDSEASGRFSYWVDKNIIQVIKK